MKKTKQLVTNYLTNKLVDPEKISQKINTFLKDAVPDNVLGMLSTSEETNNSLIFYNRWKLIIVDKNNYTIIDIYSKEVVYKNISLLISALYMIYYLNKPLYQTYTKYQLIYCLDQEYYRCLEDIKFFKRKTKLTADLEKLALFSCRLDESYDKLAKIKTQLSKIY